MKIDIDKSNFPSDGADTNISNVPKTVLQNSDLINSDVRPNAVSASNFLKMSNRDITMPSNVPENDCSKSGFDNISDEPAVAKETEENGVIAMETAADSWDAMFDDDGEALDPHIMDEVILGPVCLIQILYYLEVGHHKLKSHQFVSRESREAWIVKFVG